MIRLWNRLLESGTSLVSDPEIKRVRLSNRLSLVGGLISIATFFVYLYLEFWYLLPVLSGFIVFCFFGIYLNSIGKPDFSRKLQLTAFSLIMLACGYIFGAPYGIEYCLLPVVIIAFFFFEGNFLKFFFGLVAIEFIGLKLMYTYGLEPMMEVPGFVMYLSMAIAWSFSYVALNMFKRESALYEKRLEKKNLEISIQNHRIQDMNHHLEDLVEQKSSELDLKSKKLIDFAFFNSHKMRKPIANIRGLTSLLEEEEDEQSAHEIVRNLKESSEELDAVITELNEILSNDKSESIPTNRAATFRREEDIYLSK